MIRQQIFCVHTKHNDVCLNCLNHYSDCAPAFVAPQGRSEETARRLWDVSCELLGIEWD